MPDFPNFDHWFPPSQPPERRPRTRCATRARTT
jgi:hypothetical protein